VRALALIVVACNAAPAAPNPGSADELAQYLKTIAGEDQATRERALQNWIVPEATWDRTIVSPWKSLYRDYIASYATAEHPIQDALASLDPVAVRRHYAGDRALTIGEARLRWALPVQYPSMVATIGGRELDAVFVYDGQWRALLGLDAIVMEHVRAVDASCAANLDRIEPLGHCNEIGFVVAAAALRGGGPELVRACHMAAAMCGNPAP
jgi:predicted transcriptional regulator